MFKKKGGKVIASGGYGCVFSPALKCEGSSKRADNSITKLMTERHAKDEYDEINSIKEKLKDIPDYKDYFLVSDLTLCKPAQLEKADLKSFKKKCTALPKDKITKDNINDSLNKVLALTMPNGGIPVDDYIYDNGSFTKLLNTNNALIKLLQNGIIPMNEKNIYHCDIKDSNILISLDAHQQFVFGNK
jgi:serine/threonine protein kinase